MCQCHSYDRSPKAMPGGTFELRSYGCLWFVAMAYRAPAGIVFACDGGEGGLSLERAGRFFVRGSDRGFTAGDLPSRRWRAGSASSSHCFLISMCRLIYGLDSIIF